MADSELYMAARKSPLSLTYYGFCLINGNYTVNLHFAEIEFLPNDKSQDSLGRRVLDVYIQGKLKLKDFDIVKAAGGVRQAVIKTFNVSVTSNSLEIRLYWAGKGTQRIPEAGFYGPLVSAISVLNPGATFCFYYLCTLFLTFAIQTSSDLHSCCMFDSSTRGKNISVGAVAGIIAAVLCFVFILVGAVWWKVYLGRRNAIDKELRGLDLNTNSFTVRQIKAATNNFAAENKIGEGGFGPVYKGYLLDGTIIAVKQLSAKSKQGNREFINEIGMISGLRHPNLAKLYGCCIEGNQLLLIYEYLENNCLARALFEEEAVQLKLDWPTRQKICIGIARGLTYLHEADVYSFGVVALEIVSGKSNTNYRTKEEYVYLLDWALILQENGNLMELVGPKLESEFEEEEVLRMINIALMCTNTSPTLRPKMSSVVSMLESQTPIGEFVSNSVSESTNDLKFKAVGDYHYDQTQSISKDTPFSESSTSAADLYPLINESDYWINRD
ncbi:hypothetical protein C5167_035109 [Papaver somniferum]|uniref:non-specific serine/threonine protein kinase n=1 Tax=Papaver somniferum TaxID=3469 RepID=A0A4Y7KIV3_PAPSO|nr:hypothetical protein C5167_035109 [Papaver somniferum]